MRAAPPMPVRPRTSGRDPAALIAGVHRGDRAMLGQAITLIESNATAHRPLARKVLGAISAPKTRTLRVGISGVPGAGKSTFIEGLGNYLCDLGRRVAVLTVDPSSSLSGGSILGDKTRMETLARRSQCFIRPSPSGGVLGGVTRKTRETITLCEAAGFDTLLIETVGVGQSEIAVRSMVDCVILLLLAGAGDELQGMKKGILEIADILVVNKADGPNALRAKTTRSEFARAVPMLTPSIDGWRPPSLAISSLNPAGPAAVWTEVEKFFDHLDATGQGQSLRREQSLAWWRDLVAQEITTRFLARPEIACLSARLERDIVSGTLPASLAAEELVEQFEFPSLS